VRSSGFLPSSAVRSAGRTGGGRTNSGRWAVPRADGTPAAGGRRPAAEVGMRARGDSNGEFGPWQELTSTAHNPN
jgi:hypothetical protein